MQGINVNSTPLLAQPELIRSILSKELVLFTWGSLNNNPTNIELQKKLGVDAVIYDRCASLEAVAQPLYSCTRCTYNYRD